MPAFTKRERVVSLMLLTSFVFIVLIKFVVDRDVPAEPASLGHATT